MPGSPSLVAVCSLFSCRCGPDSVLASDMLLFRCSMLALASFASGFAARGGMMRMRAVEQGLTTKIARTLDVSMAAAAELWPGAA